MISKSSVILYKQKAEPLKTLFEALLLHKVVVILYAVIPQVIATFRVSLFEPTYEAAVKAIKEDRSKDK